MSCKWCCVTVDCSSVSNFVRRYSSRTNKRKIFLLLVGLDNAGKSCTAKRLAQEPVEGTVATVGFDMIKLKHRGFTVIIYDLGGSSQIRGIWPRYFSDVHGVIFVVDASDLKRIDESRKVLEELLDDEKLAGKPLLLLANKQDRAGALDEIDIVERLNLEVLVNHKRCPTMVETCSATGVQNGNCTKVDPGIDNGYRWIVRRVRANYEELNARVERDSEIQRLADEKERLERVRRQDTDDQTLDSLPTDNGDITSNPFKPINTLVSVREQNGHATKELNHEKFGKSEMSTDKYSTGSCATSDSPDGSSHTIDSDSNDHVYIPLHSPTREQTDLHLALESDTVLVDQAVDVNLVNAVREQLEWKMQKQKKKKKGLLKRNNRTAPVTDSGGGDTERKLPPLRTRPGTSTSLPSQGWGLSLELEQVPAVEAKESVAVEVLKSPKSLNLSHSDDDDDVVICQNLD